MSNRVLLVLLNGFGEQNGAETTAERGEGYGTCRRPERYLRCRKCDWCRTRSCGHFSCKRSLRIERSGDVGVCLAGDTIVTEPKAEIGRADKFIENVGRVTYQGVEVRR